MDTAQSGYLIEPQAMDAPQNSEAKSTRSSPLRSRKAHAGLLMAAVAAVLLGLWWHLDYQSRSKILQTTNGATIQAHSVIVAQYKIEQPLHRGQQQQRRGCRGHEI